MREKAKRVAGKMTNAIGSKWFFWLVVSLFIFQALWVAFSFRYPMLFDEKYHFGIIDYFTHQWLPWINNQPTTLDIYGALERNGHLIYHYLMSFPLRFVALFTENVAAQVISMRVINIGMFAGGLYLFDRLFRVMNIKRIFSNVTLLFVVLLPMTPLLAATVNYDNAIFLLTPLFIILAIKLITSRSPGWQMYATFLLVGLMGSLVKVSFVPIFVAAALYVSVYTLINRKTYFGNIKRSFKKTDIWLRLAMLIPLVVVGIFFVERYGVNIVKYRAIEPSCMKQMPESRCLKNPVEARDANFLKEKNRTSSTPGSIDQYSITWVNTMIYTSLYSGSSLQGGGATTAPPLPIIRMVVFVLTAVSFSMLFYVAALVKKLPGFWLIFSIILLYIAALFYTTASAYYKLNIPLAIQGRYLLPLLPTLMVFVVLGMNRAMGKWHILKLYLLAVVTILFLSGAGLVTHIMRSNGSWNWDNSKVRKVNDSARNFLEPIIKG